ncbi:MAG: hypothetical protein LBV47_00335 [Bacteroidales bacterium]|jgi:hypothetical protein|nr:hypothetical protein [Bacteroidales bacterium]
MKKMKSYFSIKTIIILGIMLCTTALKAEEDYLYYMRQRQGTQEMLKEYVAGILRSKGVDSKGMDEVYVNFIPPMGCPRCEGLVVMYSNMLHKSTAEKAYIINVLLYEKEKALMQYISQQNFPGNLLHTDTTNLFSDIFAVNGDEAMVPYLSKISLRMGRIVAAVPALGIQLDTTFVSGMIHKKDFEEFANSAVNQTSEEKGISYSLRFNIDSLRQKKMSVGKIVGALFKTPKESVNPVRIAGADTLPLIHQFAIDQTGNRLVVNNHLTNSYILYTKQGNSYESPVILAPLQEEDEMYISKSISPEISRYFKEQKVLVSMYLNTSFTGKGLYIMASLPKLEGTMVDSTASLSYSNMPVCLIKDTKNNTMRQYSFSNIDVEEKHGFIFLHPDASYFEEDSLFVFGLQKGWPAVGTGAVPKNESDSPFRDEFYSHASTLMFYNTQSGQYKLTAPLDEFFKKHRLEYYASSSLVKKCNGRYFYASQSLGKIHAMSNNFESSTTVHDFFETGTVAGHIPVREELSYIEEAGKLYLNKWIADFEVMPDNSCKAIVKDGDYWYYYDSKNSSTGIRAVFPNEIESKELSCVKFGRDKNGETVIYGLYQNSQDIVVYTFDM